LIEKAIINLRSEYLWGARKLRILFQENYPQLPAPCERTFNRILFRNNLLSEDSPPGVSYTSFEADAANDLWQIDYKGEFLFSPKTYCYPFDILDDHSRFNINLSAHSAISWLSVKENFAQAFRKYGMPKKMLMDHGTCWYSPKSRHQLTWTRLTVWQMRLNINIIYSRIRHPQTLGKLERYHRTLKKDVIKRYQFSSLEDIQMHFDAFRHRYNYERPHEGIGMQRPYQRYSRSLREFPLNLAKVEYPQGAVVMKLTSSGTLYYKGRHWFVSEALASEYVMLKERDYETDIYFMKTIVRTFNRRESSTY